MAESRVHGQPLQPHPSMQVDEETTKRPTYITMLSPAWYLVHKYQKGRTGTEIATTKLIVDLSRELCGVLPQCRGVGYKQFRGASRTKALRRPPAIRIAKRSSNSSMRNRKISITHRKKVSHLLRVRYYIPTQTSRDTCLSASINHTDFLLPGGSRGQKATILWIEHRDGW